jgi:hypothetical protein
MWTHRATDRHQPENSMKPRLKETVMRAAVVQDPVRQAPESALPAADRPNEPGVTRTQARVRRPRIAGLLRRVRRARPAGYHDPLFERPDLVEDDYYRLRNQRYG